MKGMSYLALAALAEVDSQAMYNTDILEDSGFLNRVRPSFTKGKKKRKNMLHVSKKAKLRKR